MSRLRIAPLFTFTFILLTFAAPTLADGGEPLDVPDASVDQGGADRDNEEQDDRTGRVSERCSTSRDCTRGFACEAGQCRYVGVRQADGGCLLGVQAVLFFGGLALVLRRNRLAR